MKFMRGHLEQQMVAESSAEAVCGSVAAAESARSSYSSEPMLLRAGCVR